jgi:hypothetical protein
LRMWVEAVPALAKFRQIWAQFKMVYLGVGITTGSLIMLQTQVDLRHH